MDVSSVCTLIPHPALTPLRNRPLDRMHAVFGVGDLSEGTSAGTPAYVLKPLRQDALCFGLGHDV